MRLLHRYTFAPNGWLRSVQGPGTGLWGTQFLTVGCPDDFYAVRIGFCNITVSPYVVPRIVACPSDSWNDYAHPTGDRSPVALTTAGAGADADEIVTALDAPTRLVVAGNTVDGTSGETTVPAWSWTDWCHVRSAAPDPGTNMRVLMIRHTLVTKQGAPVTCTNGMFQGWSGVRSVNKGYDYFCGGLKNGKDRTDFGAVNAHLLRSNTLVNGSFACAVQFLTKHPGVVGMTTGDSHHQGTTSTGEFNSYMAQLSVALGQEHVGVVPFGWASCAVGGAVSQQFFPYLQALMRHVHPSYVVLPGWTANEMNGSACADAISNDRFFARLLQAADLVRLNGAVPIWLTPFPRNEAFMQPDQQRAWRHLCWTILQLRASGELVVDATAVLGRQTDGEFDGTYLPTMTTDHVHPNDAGHAAVADRLKPVIKTLANLGSIGAR
jgi:hypothetical protein